MVRYYNFDIVFAEIPDEVTLAVNITGCPNRCEGCHSPHLREDVGERLDRDALAALLERYGAGVTCLCFMGGDGDPQGIARLAAEVRQLAPQLRVGWYSGRQALPAGVAPETFDYIKLGPYVASRGPLSSPETNQRMYRVGRDGAMEDITYRFRRR